MPTEHAQLTSTSSIVKHLNERLTNYKRIAGKQVNICKSDKDCPEQTLNRYTNRKQTLDALVKHLNTPDPDLSLFFKLFRVAKGKTKQDDNARTAGVIKGALSVSLLGSNKMKALRSTVKEAKASYEAITRPGAH
jgi:hypothetical protein